MKDREKDYGEAIKLEESERIRQNCIHFLELQKSHHAATFEIDECIAWLEKQRDIDKLIKELGKYKVKYTQEVLEKRINSITVPFKSTDWYVSKVDGKIHNIYGSSKPDLEAIKEEKANNVEPKFKIGDWIVYNRTDNSREIMQIHDIRDNRYYFTDNIHFSWSIKECDEKSHLWTIQDAKDGDVLFQDLMSGKTFIYNGINPDMAILYSFIINNDGEDVLPYHIGEPNTGIGYVEENKNIIHPATKEQRNILFQKVHEAGYEWNDKRKKLRKINQKEEKIMAQYIDKNKVEDILRKLWKEDDGHNSEHRICYNKALQDIQCKLDTLEVKETELKGIEKEVAEGHVGLVDKKRVPIELKGELKAKFKNEFNTLWQIVNGIQFANVAKHIVERICLNFAIWGAYNLKIGQTELTEIKDESEDETVRKYFIAKFKKMLEEDNLQALGTVDTSNLLAWLEKQEEKKPLYIRFGDVPSNETSKIHRGEVEIGEENGVSVYPAFELNGNVVLGLTLPITKTTLYTQQHLLEYDNRPCYLVSGDYVGKGTDGEPLIRNISIIKRLDNYRVKEKKQGKQETLCDKCRKEHPSHSCQDITELGRCQVKESTKIQHDNKTCKENDDSLTDDERIKGEIIDFIYDKTDTYELREKSNSWLTWLEKQGIKPLGQVEDKTELSETEGNKVITDWSEEDKKMFRSLHNLIYVVRDCDCDSMEKEELSDWLESIKDRVQPKQEWSEEDEYLLGETIQHLEELIRIDKAKHCACDVQYYQRDIDWLKSLKKRIVPQQKEWSKEDDSALNNIIDTLVNYRDGFKSRQVKESFNEDITWLNSLRERAVKKL